MQRFFFFLLNIVLKIFRAELGNMSLKELLTDSEENREQLCQLQEIPYFYKGQGQFQ